MIDHFLLPILLYPEIHFRFFKLFPSLLYRKFPEVAFDMPRRLNPGRDLPVVLIVNDINQYPVDVVNVQIALSHKSMPPRLFNFDAPRKHLIDHPFSFQSMVFIFSIPRNELQNGLFFVNCIARIKKGNRTTTILNDNFFMTSKLPFSCDVSDSTLPGSEFCSYGDLHVHSHYSQSHVEFGPPVSIIDLFSKCYGNDFVAITDHSYDLACEMYNYLKIDNDLSRWKSIRSETSNRNFLESLILGEEISCTNSKKKTVHLCGIGIKDFVPGSSDGARHNANKNKTLALEKVIESIHKQGGIAFAAHPGSKMGFIQRIFLKRGNWNQQDFKCKLDGIQAVNNGFGNSWNRAKKLWIKELLKGHKLPLLGGNDSHGDFNRYRYLSVPFLSIQENFARYFSSIKTGVYAKISSEKELIDAVKNGATFVTSGPFIGLSKSKSLQDNLVSNDEIELDKESLIIQLKSNHEFGLPYSVQLSYGKINASRERVYFIKYLKAPEFDAFIEVPISDLRGKGYLRAEAEFRKPDGTTNYAVTSPCYFNRTII